MNITQSNPIKQLSLTILVAITCLLLSLHFPASSSFEKITRSVFFLLVVPFFYIKTALGKNLADFGLNLKNKTAGILGGILALAASLGYFYLSQKYAFLRVDSPIPLLATANFSWFVFYQLVFVGINIFCLEFFFRGFLLFSLAEKFSAWTVIFQGILYVFYGLSGYASLALFFQLLFVSMVSGILAFRTRSIAYSYGIMLLANILIDAWIIRG